MTARTRHLATGKMDTVAHLLRAADVPLWRNDLSFLRSLHLRRTRQVGPPLLTLLSLAYLVHSGGEESTTELFGFCVMKCVLRKHFLGFPPPAHLPYLEGGSK